MTSAWLLIVLGGFTVPVATKDQCVAAIQAYRPAVGAYCIGPYGETTRWTCSENSIWTERKPCEPEPAK